jgi:protein O-GlcNAc transferase
MTAFSLTDESTILSIEQKLERTVETVLQLAVNHHQSGQILDAERLYRAVLQIQPNHPSANHKLGILLFEAQQPTAGLLKLEMALEACPEDEQYWFSYIDALIQTDQLEIARQVLEVGLQHGLQGKKFESFVRQLGAHQQAMAPSILKQPNITATPLLADLEHEKKPKKISSKKSIKKKATVKCSGGAPSSAQISALLARLGQGQNTELEVLARSLTKQFPQHGFGWKVLGALLQVQGRPDEALPYAQKAAKLLPADAEAHSNLGTILQNQGRLAEAEASLRLAIALQPDYAMGYCNIGNVLQKMGRLSEAEVSLRQALAISPDYAKALNSLGNLLQG